MAGTQKDIQLIEYKDTIKQLNMTVKSQNELILSLKDTIASNPGTDAYHDRTV